VSSHKISLLDAETPPDPRAHGPFAALRRVLPSGEVIRFLLVGSIEYAGRAGALFGICDPVWASVAASRKAADRGSLRQIVSKPLAITVAFLCYKHFVFRTKGNYLREWLKCFAVYGISTPAELIILPLATKAFLLPALTHPYAPFLAGIVNSVMIACYSYFAHKKFSFKR
jgi:putative flippase GtrA